MSILRARLFEIEETKRRDEQDEARRSQVGTVKRTDPNHISVMDTTLRDGEQTPDVAYTAAEKLQLARLLLEDVGVDRIEIGSTRVDVSVPAPGERDLIVGPRRRLLADTVVREALLRRADVRAGEARRAVRRRLTGLSAEASLRRAAVGACFGSRRRATTKDAECTRFAIVVRLAAGAEHAVAVAAQLRASAVCVARIASAWTVARTASAVAVAAWA